MNKYRDRIFNLAKNSNARLVLPEKNDKRIIAACEKLDSMGFTIININDYLNNNGIKTGLYNFDINRNIFMHFCCTFEFGYFCCYN